MTRRTLVAAALLAAALFAPACPRPRGPSVVLIVIDALRADHLGALGSARETTPYLDSLAREGALFSALSQSSLTGPSVASILSGLWPDADGVVAEGDVLQPGVETLAEYLRGQGYETGCVQNNPWLEQRFGFAQGFDWFRQLYPGDLLAQQQKQSYRAEEVNRAAAQWLAARGSRPFFLYLHYMDVHSPYLPPAPYDRMFDPGFDRALPDFTLVYRFLYGPEKAPLPPDMEAVYLRTYTDGQLLGHMGALYDGGLRYLDDQLRALLIPLRAQRPDTIIVICSDHGEEFQEHGRLQHGKTLFHEVAAVPLLIVAPGRAPAGRVAGIARNLDIFPTVADLLGAPAPDSLHGRSLRGLWKKSAGPAFSFGRVYYSGTATIGADGTMRNLVSATNANWRLIRDLSSGRNALYDLADRPPDTHDLCAAKPEACAELEKAVDQYFGLCLSTARRLGIAPSVKAPMDEDMKKRLRSLGYLQ